MRLPFYQVGASDAGAHVAQLCGSGDTTVLLENYVKTGQQTLEEAVHYMTVAPQRRFALAAFALPCSLLVSENTC